MEPESEDLTILQGSYDEEVRKVKEHAEKVVAKVKEDEQRLLGRLRAEFEYRKGQLHADAKQTSKVPLKFLPETRLLDRETVVLGYTGKVDASRTKVEILKYVLVGNNEDMYVETFDFLGDKSSGSAEYDIVCIEVSSSEGSGRIVDVVSQTGGTHTFKFPAEREGMHRLSISIGGRAIPGSPFHTEVLSVKGYADKMVVGSQVARGRNWEYKNQDGNPPGRGRVTRKQGDNVSVQWDCGNSATYHMEATSGYFQLKLAEYH